MSMHKIPLTEVEREGLVTHCFAVDSPNQLSDSFRLGVAWSEAKKVEWTCIEQSHPVQEGVFWVVGGNVGRNPILAKFKQNSSQEGKSPCWQTLSCNDFSIIGTKWILIEQPKPPSLQKSKSVEIYEEQ